MSAQTASAIQLLANQVNALKSTGPRTDAGKNIARFNARRHGLTGQFYCMSENDELAYRAFETDLLTDLKPVGPYESQLALSIIQDQWRLNRSRGVEFNLIGLGHNHHAPDTEANTPEIQAAATMANTWQDEDRRFANIALYQTRIHRMITRNRAELRHLQDERKAAEAAALREAELLTRLALMKRETVDPKQSREVDGFVFSNVRLTQLIHRKDQLLEAQHYAQTGWGRPAFPKTAEART